jgi:very-short-patch-repair endonuclease
MSRASTARARNLRQRETFAEAALWHPIGRYIADFACVKARLVVELDGAVHRDDEQVLREIERTTEIEAFGWHVLRFTNEEVLREPSPVPQRILKMCQTGGVGDPLPPTRFARGSLPLPRGEGNV